VFFTILVACAVVALIQQYVKYSLSLQRRIYWSCASLGAAAAFLAFYPDSEKGFGMGLFFLGVMIVAAYGYTPYIKIGRKVYALTVQNREIESDESSGQSSETDGSDEDHDLAPDSYSGLLTSTKMWWLLIPLLVISTGNIYAFAFSTGKWWVAAIGLVLLVLLAVVLGFGDAGWGHEIARGHRVQFAIAAVVTMGVFAALYVAAYQTGKHWPMRRKQSVEYRARPGHQKLD
jgi:hypothetical protein